MPDATDTAVKMDPDSEKGQQDYNICQADEYVLSETEKRFILAAERGDCANVKRMIDENKNYPQEFNINCVDPLNRSALISAIENENFELIELLLEEGIRVGDALLHAISEEYVEAVEELLIWEENHHVEGQPYSWEAVDRSKSNFTPDITPLILAAHRNNYEILKLLLDRGATLPMPHDVKCGCDECISAQETNSLRYSQSRINAYRALTASSLIALSSRDPVLSAFELSWELKHLQVLESEYRNAYTEMRQNVQEFVTALLDHARTSTELEIMLNYNHEATTTDIWMPGQRQTLERLKLAIKYKQKNFVAHPNVQQLLATIWYDGLPGFRRKTTFQQLTQVITLGCSFPIYSMHYILAPNSDKAKLMRKPFVKFIMHSTSYMFFLMLLASASLRIIQITFELFAFPWMLDILEDWKKHERGSLPGPIELGIIMYICSFILGELKALYDSGLMEYISDLWNIVDFISIQFYVTWILMRITSWIIAHRDLWFRDINPYFPREHWHPFDPMLIAEGAFAAGMIFSFLKLVHIFSINPHLGPLQVSLGRMIIDIIKFFFIYTLVLFAFGCGLNQLLWYYADLEKHKCYHLHPDVADFDDQEKACTIYRRFANLFETSQSLFWASFGLVDLVSFDLAGIKGFTRFWALLMFGSYSVINIIVLLNMLIAMMSNSYQVIYEKSDTEWKFARSELWMSYFEDGATLPPPFNMCPSVKFLQSFGKKKDRGKSIIRKAFEKAQALHDKVMRLLVRRYVTAEQRKRDDYGITEDDIIEVRADISSFRYELLDILDKNNMTIPDIKKKGEAGTKKGRVMERRIMKDFQIGIVEKIALDMKEGESKDIFSAIANVMGKKKSGESMKMGIKKEKKDWNAIVRKNFISGDPIGSRHSSMIRRSQRSLRRKIIEEANEGLKIDQDKLVQFNPKLSDVTPTTRVAYVKFMQKTLNKREELEALQESNEKPKVSSIKKSESTNKPAPGSKPDEPKMIAKPGAPSPPKKDETKTSTTTTITSAPAPQLGSKVDGSKTITKPGAPSPPKKDETKASSASTTSSAPAHKAAPSSAPGAPPAKPPDNVVKKDEPQKTNGPPPPKLAAPTSAAAEGDAKKASDTKKTVDSDKQKSTDKPTGGNDSSDKPAGGSGGSTAVTNDSTTKSTTMTPNDDKKMNDVKKSDDTNKLDDGKKPEAKKPAAQKPPPGPVTKPGQSAAASGGDRGKSSVTGRMISGWL